MNWSLYITEFAIIRMKNMGICDVIIISRHKQLRMTHTIADQYENLKRVDDFRYTK